MKEKAALLIESLLVRKTGKNTQSEPELMALPVSLSLVLTCILGALAFLAGVFLPPSSSHAQSSSYEMKTPGCISLEDRQIIFSVRNAKVSEFEIAGGYLPYRKNETPAIGVPSLGGVPDRTMNIYLNRVYDDSVVSIYLDRAMGSMWVKIDLEMTVGEYLGLSSESRPQECMKNVGAHLSYAPLFPNSGANQNEVGRINKFHLYMQNERGTSYAFAFR